MSSPKQSIRAIDWKKLKNYEIVSVWQPAFQAEVLKYIAELLLEGFQLLSIMTFLKQVYPKQSDTFDAMASDLATGHNFHEVVGHMRLAPMITFRIRMAETMGDFPKQLLMIAEYLAYLAEQRQKLRQIVMYPIFLSMMLLGLLFGLRTFLLPQLEQMSGRSGSTVLSVLLFGLEYLPQLLVLLLGIVSATTLLIYTVKAHVPPLRWVQWQTQLPIIGTSLRLYHTFVFSREFGELFALGYSIKQIMLSFSDQKEVPFLSEFGQQLLANYNEGMALTESLTTSQLFTEEFPAIVSQGELLNELAIKLCLYSERCFTRWQAVVEKQIKWFQNSLFVGIALIVVSVYLSLMLPMFNMIGEI